MPELRWLAYDDPGFEQEVQALRTVLRGGGLTAASERPDLDVNAIVTEILREVAQGGDRAVAALTSRLDGADLSPEGLRVPLEALANAHSGLDPNLLGVLRGAMGNIRTYQEHIRLQAPAPLRRNGRTLGVRYTPVDRVGVYVPGGRALYPSTVLMTILPAQAAGVREIVMVSPPTGGSIHPLALGLAHELGIREVYQIGGAVAIAALAYGTETIRPVQKIVGPGNAFVAAAKRQLFGKVGIDSIAGPSEVFIIADETARPAWIAADLIAQAEHDPGSAILATPSRELARQVLSAIGAELGTLERREAALASLAKYGALIVTRDLAHACDLASAFATEHLQIMTAHDEECLSRVRHAGAIFVGHHTPVPLGDYFAGPSHVLPTGGTAQFFGPLSVNDFLKASSIVEYEPAALEADAPAVIEFASREGLTAHARAVGIRRSGA